MRRQTPTLQRRALLRGLLAAGCLLALPRRGHTRPAPLVRLCAAIAPGAHGLPGAAALSAHRIVARRRDDATVTPLLDEVARTSVLDDAALARLADAHPAEMRSVRAALYRVLYVEHASTTWAV